MSLITKLKSEFASIEMGAITLIEDLTGSKEVTVLKNIAVDLQKVEAFLATPAGMTAEMLVRDLIPGGAQAEAVATTVLVELTKAAQSLANNPSGQLTILREIAAQLYILYTGKDLKASTALAAIEKIFNLG